MIKNSLKFILVLLVSAFIIYQPVHSHPGRTDSRGGHYCRTNCASWGLRDGEYHYHNGGGPTPAPKPAPTPAPKPSVPKPRPATPAPAPKPEPKKLIHTLNDLAKNNRDNVILVDLLLKESARNTSASDYQTIKPIDIARSRISGATQEPKALGGSNYYYVNSVIDGDTIKVVIGGRIEKVRLLGIDTPETKDPRKPVQCFGDEASKYAKSLMEGKYVRLEADSSQSDKDKYNRLLRYVYLEDGTEVNESLVSNGYAVAYLRYPVNRTDLYKSKQTSAEQGQLGLWGSCR